ncbi:MAG: 3-oxoacyl-ACP synthase [Thermobacillus sp. ZCTH02-B1]|uniref:ketoacyl-ACP synthase III n=1 Tax=Thermobacillus sp. ZCTH02-B1 TaxID=1858795 RepID=UPI000B57071D|nr:ketoacyl-ACP synthase III [Thermobacillus sp. ZCTH02-B1]OUM94758.1 MAG: 3-oxoacyl-ACP synthase [Thermobacillus sp. ZCTH02-B1]
MYHASRIRTNAAVTAIGTHVPGRVLTNADLERMVDTSDEWIVRRTGIRERRIAAEGEYASHLAAAAVRDLAARWNKTVDDVDCILTATSTPDAVFPGVSALVQAELGIRAAAAVDLSAACAGFVAGLQMAGGLIGSGLYRKVLVIAADTLSRVTDYTDRTTCILFGDGAGAALVEALPDGEPPSFLAGGASTDGRNGCHVLLPALAPEIRGTAVKPGGKLVQNGPEVYRWAVENVTEAVRTTLDLCGMTPDDLDWFVPHSANLRMIAAICERAGIPFERTLTSVERFGNTSAATIPLALNLAVRDGRLKRGDAVLLHGFGGGLTQAGLLLEWRLP